MYRIVKVINGKNAGQYEIQMEKTTKELYSTVYKNKECSECYQQYLTLINPIKDNRIINDQTFATRLLSFLDRTDVVYQSSHEEKEYLMQVAKNLLEYQKRTANTKEEKDYLLRTCTKQNYQKQID